MLHAASRVVIRNRLHTPMLAEKVAALIERHLMRKDLFDISKTDARKRHQVMPDAQKELARDGDILRQQQIVVHGNAARQRVLNRDHRDCGLTALERLKYL